MQDYRREAGTQLALSLVLSVGLHGIALLTLDLSPGTWRHGFAPALRVILRGLPDAERRDAAAVPAPGAAAQTTPTPPPADPSGQPRASAVASESPAAGRRDGSAGAVSPADGRASPAPATGSTLPLSDRYYSNSEVDVRAVPLERTPLVFPEDALRARIRGVVRARVYVNERGGIDAIDILSSHPPGVFEPAALEALKQVRYSPALLGGRAVRTQKVIEINFDPTEGETRRN